MASYTGKTQPLPEYIHERSSFLFDGLAIHTITVFTRDEIQVPKMARDSEMSTIRARIGQRNENPQVERILRFVVERMDRIQPKWRFRQRYLGSGCALGRNTN